VSQIAAAVHRLLQIGIVGNLASLDANDKAAASGSPITSNRNSWKRTELKNIRTSALLLVHRLLQIGIVGNSQIAAETLMTSPSCSPITSNRNSWKLFDLPTESLYSSRVHRLLQIGIVGNSNSVSSPDTSISIAVHRLLQIGIVGNFSGSVPIAAAWATSFLVRFTDYFKSE